MSDRFPIVVLGDSIQWGQGLKAPHKIAELVGVALAGNPKTGVGSVEVLTFFRFAHSGATINTALDSTQGPTLAPASPSAEVPSATPTITDQVAGAVSALQVAQIPVTEIRLVILDGGINDVGVANILNPFASGDTLRATTNAACGGALTVPGAAALAGGKATGQMTNLLTAVGAAFPKAVVVVTGYYDILSASSDVTGLVMAIALQIGSFVSDAIALVGGGGLGPYSWLLEVLTGSIVSSDVASAAISNCAAFQSTSDTSLSSAVALANEAPNGSFRGPGGTRVPRFIFVPAPFAPVNALFTDNGSTGADEAAPTAPALLWGFTPTPDAIVSIIDTAVGAGSTIGSIVGFVLGGPFGGLLGSTIGAGGGAAAAITTITSELSAVDEVVSSRLGACDRFAGGALDCNLASVGHPNIEGDAAYAAAVAEPLMTMFGVTLPALRARTNVSYLEPLLLQG
jgi:hypothetical protein